MLGAVAAGIFGVAAQASAQQVQFHGGVTGCFTTGVSCPTVDFGLGAAFADNAGPAAANVTPAGPYLRYDASTFDNTTDAVFNHAGFNGLGASKFGKVGVDGNFTAVAGLKLILTFYFDPSYTTIFGPAGTPTTAPGPLQVASVLFNVTTTPTVSGGVHFDFGGAAVFSFTNGGIDCVDHATGAPLAGAAARCTHNGIATLAINDFRSLPGQQEHRYLGLDRHPHH